MSDSKRKRKSEKYRKALSTLFFYKSIFISSEDRYHHQMYLMEFEAFLFPVSICITIFIFTWRRRRPIDTEREVE